MPQFLKKRGKKILLLLIVLSVFAALLVLTCFVPSDSRKFRQLSDDLLRNELSSNSIHLHYTLAYPENYGLQLPPSLPSSFSEEGSHEQILIWKSRLSHIHPEHLSKQDQYAYLLFSSYLDTALEGASFSYYYEPMSPSSGMISGIPILLADYTFRNVEDVNQYLEILDQTDTYFDGLIAYEYEKSAAGLFMSDEAAEKIIEQCCSIMDPDILSSGEHFLQQTFEERLDELGSHVLLTASQKENWISQNNRLLSTVMAPAYERVADAFLILKGTGTNPNGLFYYPKGKAYYEYLVHSTTGSSRSIEEIKKMLELSFQSNWNDLKKLLQDHPELLGSMDDPLLTAFPEKESGQDSMLLLSESMLEDLKQQMEKDFPSLSSQTKDAPVTYTIKKVSPSMQDFSSPAYYLTPPIDDMQHNTIYINSKSISDHLSLYTTLAHEGYPGHLYQTVYTQSFLNSQDASCIRSLLHYGGFVEGWALYVENLSYQYASNLAADSTAASYMEACRLNRDLLLCLYSYMDIAIHYEGATMEQIESFLAKLGILQKSSVQNVYAYLVEEPGNYLKYYLGYLEFLALKNQAKTLWKEQYSDYTFHKFVLETGNSDFSSLQMQLNQFIE